VGGLKGNAFGGRGRMKNSHVSGSGTSTPCNYEDMAKRDGIWEKCMTAADEWTSRRRRPSSGGGGK